MARRRTAVPLPRTMRDPSRRDSIRVARPPLPSPRRQISALTLHHRQVDQPQPVVSATILQEEPLARLPGMAKVPAGSKRSTARRISRGRGRAESTAQTRERSERTDELILKRGVRAWARTMYWSRHQSRPGRRVGTRRPFSTSRPCPAPRDRTKR